MDVYGTLFRSVLFPTWETSVKKRSTFPLLRFLEETQWRSPDELAAIQTGALRRLMRHAAVNVPLYRQRFKEAGLAPDSIKEPADLLRLRPLTRDDARRHVKERESEAPPFIEIRKNTGGTTAEPLLFGYDRESESWRQATKLRGYAWAGYRPGDVSVHFWGSTNPRPPGRITRAKVAADHIVRREHYYPCGVLSEEAMMDVVRAIRQRRPRALFCYTQSGAELARFINREGLRDWNNVAIITGAEKLYPHDRTDLQRAFGPNVFETYGCREFMLIGSECELHDGLHLSMENLVVEVLVEENGKTRHAREGEDGELAITDLHNYAMPFIRYITGDRVRMGSPSRCGCGRLLPRLAAVEGRTAELLRDKHGNAVSGLVFNVIFTPLAQAVRRFQVVQHRDRSVTMRVIRGEDTSDKPIEDARRTMMDLLKGVEVRIEEVKELEATATGKRRIVVVERD
jgi:phenylacetate-CoA ligase